MCTCVHACAASLGTPLPLAHVGGRRNSRGSATSLGAIRCVNGLQAAQRHHCKGCIVASRAGCCHLAQCLAGGGSGRGTEIWVLSTNMLRGRQGHCTCCLSDVQIDDLVTGTRLLKRPQCLPWWGLTHLYVGDVLKAVQRATRWVCTTLSQASFGWQGSGAQRCGANTATVDLDWTGPLSPLKLLLTASPPHLTSLSPASFTQQAPQNVW